MVRRSPADLRGLSKIPAERNAKGIALFCLAQLANHRRLKTAASETQARSLLADLLSMRLDGYRGAAWGYNFDWQSRKFFAPKGTTKPIVAKFIAAVVDTLADSAVL